MPAERTQVIRPRRRVAPRQRSPLAEQAKANWKEHRPKMYAELEKAGKLDEVAQRAPDQMSEKLNSAIENGTVYYTAWEMLREDTGSCQQKKMCCCSGRSKRQSTAVWKECR